MKIRDLSIDGFGVWSDLRLAGLADGLNVVYGPNEAGKTTLMQFLRAMLYGFTPDRRARYLPPVYGGAPGGEITLASGEGTVTLRRHVSAVDPTAGRIGNGSDPIIGRLAIVAGGETLRDDGLLARLLGNVDEAVYRNVFAIGLREIQELGALSDTAAAEWLYKLAAGTDRVSLVDVLSELSKARERLVGTDAGLAAIPQLLAERDRLRREAHQQTPLRRYGELARQRREIAAQIEAAERDAEAAERSARLAEAAAAIFDKWHERRALDERLAAARAKPRIEQQTMADFEALSAVHERGTRRAKSLARRRAEVRQAIETLGLNEALWRRRTRIEALLDEEQWITALDAERVALAAKIGAVERERAELCVPLGLDPAAAAPATSGEATDDAWRRLKPLALALRTAREDLVSRTGAAETQQKAVNDGAKQLSAALASRGASSLAPLMERGGELVSRLRRRVQCDDRLAELSQQRSALEERSREMLDRALLPGWAVVVLGIVFVLGVMAAIVGLAGFFFSSAWLAGIKWPATALGIAAAGGSAAAKFLLERTFVRRSNTCLKQLETIAAQVDELTHERDALDAQLPAGGGPLLARLQAAEKEQAAVEALVPLDAQRQAAAAAAEAAENLREQAHQAYIEARSRWRHALADAGLSPKTPPGRAREMSRLRMKLADVDARLSLERGELARRQSVIDAFCQRLAQLRAELDIAAGAPPPASVAVQASGPAPMSSPPAASEPSTSPIVAIPSGPLVEQLRSLRDRLREQAALVARRKSLVRQARRLRDRRHKTRLRLRSCERRLDEILHSIGVADTAALRRRVEESAQADRWADEHDALSAAIAALVGLQFKEEEVAALVAAHTRPQLDEQWLTLTASVRQLHEQAKSAHEQLGRNEQEAQTLRDDRQAGRARLRLGTIERQLRDAIERWRVLGATEWLLRGVRRRYERDRQPETLREASGYLERLTEGRYRRVWTPLEQNVLRVDDHEGRSLPVDVLSRGTREQLFLSLRLALAGWYTRRGIDLPLVLDDVLVNFDARRAAAAAALLRDFAAGGHQVLLFTCHEHMYQMFRALGVAARELPANPGRKLASNAIAAEQNVPLAPAVLPLPPVTARPEPTEVVIPPPQPTNGHRTERDAAAEVAPPAALPTPAPARKPSPKGRALVKFDCVHGPRGPFASALWHEPVTFEVSGDSDKDIDREADDEWTDISVDE